ncbi:MAG: xanthine dehydrogenase family protein subunit M [Rubrivivax sp.]|nr:xanthine dehydrogenase family protein subunit M [Rubrivivax sp.]
MNAQASAAAAAPAAAFEHYLAPASLAQALAALAASGGATVLAGGTDLMPQLHAGRLRPAATLLNIRRVPGLDTVHAAGGTLCLGALSTVATLLTHPLVRAHAPLLRQAADHFASDQIRNAATVGGNICNASPAGDLLTPLLALDAVVELASLAADGSVTLRAMPLDGFFTAPGRTRREAHELLTAVRLPLAPPGQRARFYKTGTRPALDIATISIAFAARRDEAGRLCDVRLAFGALGPTPLRALRTEALLEGGRLDASLAAQAAACAASEVTPIDDVRASAWYRLELVRNMTRRMLDDVAHA